jgi:hypothetical protein
MPNTDLHPTDIPVEQLLKAEVMSGEVLAQIALGHERFCYGIHHHDDGQIEEEWGNWRDVAKQLATDLSSAATRLRAMGAAGEQLQNTAHARMAEHAASRARAIQLKSALENWGRHFTWCAVWKEIPGAPPMPCDCGLARELDTATAHLQMGAAVGEQKTEINSGVCVCGHDETDHGSTQCWFGGPFAATPCHCIHYRPAPSVPHPQHPPHGAVEDKGEPGTPERDLRVIASRIAADLVRAGARGYAPGHLTNWCVMRLVEIADSLTQHPPHGARGGDAEDEHDSHPQVGQCCNYASRLVYGDCRYCGRKRPANADDPIAVPVAPAPSASNPHGDGSRVERWAVVDSDGNDFAYWGDNKEPPYIARALRSTHRTCRLVELRDGEGIWSRRDVARDAATISELRAANQSLWHATQQSPSTPIVEAWAVVDRNGLAALYFNKPEVNDPATSRVVRLVPDTAIEASGQGSEPERKAIWQQVEDAASHVPDWIDDPVRRAASLEARTGPETEKTRQQRNVDKSPSTAGAALPPPLVEAWALNEQQREVLVHLLDRSGRVFNILTSAERAVITTILQSPTAIEALNTVEAEYDGPYCTAGSGFQIGSTGGANLREAIDAAIAPTPDAARPHE